MFDKPNDANRPDTAGSDEMVNIANHHAPNDEMSEAEEMLPAELEPVHQQLAAIGEKWRTRIPPADRLVSYARNVGAVYMASDVTPSATTSSPYTADTAAGYDASAARFSLTHRPHGRARLLMTVAAAFAVVALLAGVFAMFAPGRFAGKGSTTPTVTRGTNTPTPRPTLPVTGQWVTAPQLSNLPNAPLMAPSNPRIIYQTGAQLQRSDNGGTTWRVIPTPRYSDPGVGSVTIGGMNISTNDPNTIEISVIVGVSSSDQSLCPAGTHFFTSMDGVAFTVAPMGYSGSSANTHLSQTSLTPLLPQIPMNGSISCLAEFASRDGGAHWNQVHVPMGIYGPSGPHQSRYLQGQGDRLYGVEYEQGDPNLGYRIVTSTDAAHWQLVGDIPHLAQNQHICDIQTTPTGTTIFAVTLADATGCFSVHQSPSLPYQIWRSEDAGAHWQQMGTLSAHSVGLLAVTPSDTGGWLLYAAIHGTDYVSSDGGATWQQAPQTGIQTGQTPYGLIAGTLADGSIVEAFEAPRSAQAVDHPAVTIAFYAWRAGDSAWQRVSPPITVDVTYGVQLLAIPGAPGRRNEIWVTEYSPPAYAMHRFDV